MTTDPYETLKTIQKESWALFAPLENVTTMTAAKLVGFSGVKSSHTILDVGCGTGVVAITAARIGAKVSALDLSPALVERAKMNVSLAEVEVELQEGDVEALPYPDHSFDAVLSQFGHMFAPRPHVAIQEMLRVLKPGGVIAFSTWPPDLYVGKLFNLVSQYSPPPPGAPPSAQWGDPAFVREILGDNVEGLIFDQDVMQFPALSLGHYRRSIETTVGPILKFIQDSKDNPARLKEFRNAVNALVAPYFADNHIRQHYLMSRAVKKYIG